MTAPSSAGQGPGGPLPVMPGDPRYARQEPLPPTGWYGPPPGTQGPPTGWYGPPPDVKGPLPSAPYGVPPSGWSPQDPRRRPARRRRSRRPWVVLTVVIAVAVAVGGWANVLGVREKVEHLVARVDLALHPPADRDTAPTIEITPHPGELDDGDVAVALPDPSDEVELIAVPDAASLDPSPGRSTGPPGAP